MIPKIDMVIIENIWPAIDGGRYPVKIEIGDSIEVWADIFSHGHQIISSFLLYRQRGKKRWQRIPMRHFDNDRWHATFTPKEIGRYEYAIEAVRDDFKSWRQDFIKKYDANQEVSSDVLEGIQMVKNRCKKIKGDEKKLLTELMKKLEKEVIIKKKPLKTNEIYKPNLLVEKTLLLDETYMIMDKNPDLTEASMSRIFPLMVDRIAARYSTWYEMFHRSQGTEEGKSATFDDMILRLDDIAAMGFDVIYLPPIHPIGYINRKGQMTQPSVLQAHRVVHGQ
jgi:starch synthase (maltosyl-transferring)